MQQRVRAAVSTGSVPHASWWSSNEVEVASDQWCRAPPDFSLPKPQLATTTPPAGWREQPPRLTKELVNSHASPENFIIVTYVNFKRLDFAYTMVRHLHSLRQPHFLVGAMDLPALEGLLSHSVPSFYIATGLTTADYGWGYEHHGVPSGPDRLRAVTEAPSNE